MQISLQLLYEDLCNFTYTQTHKNAAKLRIVRDVTTGFLLLTG